MALKFKVGDRVRVKKDSGWQLIEGYTGTVRLAQDSARGFPYNITLDDLPEAAHVYGTTLDNWIMAEDEIEEV